VGANERADNLVFENAAISNKDGEQPLYSIRKDLDFLQYVNQAAPFPARTHRGTPQKHINKQASAAVKETFQQLHLRVEDCIEAEMVKIITFKSLLSKT